MVAQSAPRRILEPAIAAKELASTPLVGCCCPVAQVIGHDREGPDTSLEVRYKGSLYSVLGAPALLYCRYDSQHHWFRAFSSSRRFHTRPSSSLAVTAGKVAVFNVAAKHPRLLYRRAEVCNF
jgi:hypothetical protein